MRINLVTKIEPFEEDLAVEICHMIDKDFFKRFYFGYKIYSQSCGGFSTAKSSSKGLKVPCRLCQLDTDSISHILQCVLLKLQVPQILTNSDVSTDDAFKNNLDRMETLANLFEKAWRKREEIIEKENDE